MKKIILQFFLYSVFAGSVWYFSDHPDYVYIDPKMAMIKISFSHAGQRKEACRKLTQEELEQLAPNMRKPSECKRERFPITVEFNLDDKKILYKTFKPAGLAKDGVSTVYKPIVASAGKHVIYIRMRDSSLDGNFDYERKESILLKPGQNFVISFNGESGDFIFL